MGFLDLAGRQVKQLRPGIDLRTFWGEQMLFSHVTLEPGATVPLHSHPHEQGGVILAGEVAFTCQGEETRTLKAGDMYIVPGNVQHMVVAGAQGCVALDIFVPVREEYKFPNDG